MTTKTAKGYTEHLWHARREMIDKEGKTWLSECITRQNYSRYKNYLCIMENMGAWERS